MRLKSYKGMALLSTSDRVSIGKPVVHKKSGDTVNQNVVFYMKERRVGIKVMFPEITLGVDNVGVAITSEKEVSEHGEGRCLKAEMGDT